MLGERDNQYTTETGVDDIWEMFGVLAQLRQRAREEKQVLFSPGSLQTCSAEGFFTCQEGFVPLPQG